jgi:hypothetical protein
MRIRNTVTAAVPIAAALALASPTWASPAIGGAARPHPVRGGAASHGSLHSPQFAGWEVTLSGDGFSETTTIVLPKLKCRAAKQAITPNVGTLVNGETSYNEAGMFVGCSGGKARYYPAFVVENAFKNFPKLKAQAGDTIVLTEVMRTARPGELSVIDKTTKSVHKTLSVPQVTDSDFPWVGDSAWLTNGMVPLPVPDFGTITFSHTRFLRKPMRKFFPDGDLVSWDRYNGTTLQIKTGKWASDLQTFKTVFHHS